MSSEAARTDWVDAARGIGIVLVVVGHMVIGLADAGQLDRSSAAWRLQYVIYTFHMPLFFMLSGLFVPQAVARGRGPMLRNLALRMVWPYLLWSTVQLLVLGLAAGVVNNAVNISPARWVALLWQPASQFWFLHTLILLQLAACLLLPRLGAQGLLWLALALLMVPALVKLPPALVNPCRFALYFALGVLASPHRLQALSRVPRLPRVAVALAALALCALIGLALLPQGLIPWAIQALPAALLGLLACVLLAQSLPDWARRRFAALGVSSLAIFALHIMFGAGARIVLSRAAHLQDPNGLLAATIAAGLLGPLLVEQAARAAGAQRWLGLGR